MPVCRYYKQIIEKSTELPSTAMAEREKRVEKHLSLFCKVRMDENQCLCYVVIKRKPAHHRRHGSRYGQRIQGKFLSFTEVNKCFLQAMEINLQRNKSLETKFPLRQLQTSTHCFLRR